MSASNSPRLHWKKPKSVKKLRVRPAKRRKQPSARMKALMAEDRRESAKVRTRSEGQCEARERRHGLPPWRCVMDAEHVHHMLSGRGRRLSAEGVKAERKQHLCHRCHRDITGDIGGKKLIRVGGPVPHRTDSYTRRSA